MEIPEVQTQTKMFEYFANWFTVYKEVTSKCRKGRIDLILFHKTDLLKRYPFGVEIKRVSIKRGGELGQWLNQARDYTSMSFMDQLIHVFVYPQVSFNYLKEGTDISQHDIFADGIMGLHYNVNSFLYRSFKIGEIQKYKHWKLGWQCRFVMNTFLIWDSANPTYFNIDKLNNL